MVPTKKFTFKCDLGIGLTSMYVSNGTSTCDGEKLCQINRNPSTIVEVKVPILGL